MANVIKMKKASDQTGVCVFHREGGRTADDPCTDGDCARKRGMRQAQKALAAINVLAGELADSVLHAGDGFGDDVQTACGSILGTAMAIQGLAASAGSETPWNIL